jgi:hypothetical protein
MSMSDILAIISALSAAAAFVPPAAEWLSNKTDPYKFLLFMLGGACAVVFGIAAALFAL